MKWNDMNEIKKIEMVFHPRREWQRSFNQKKHNVTIYHQEE
jgi:predicted amidophosphoribosyltransferase